MVLINFKMVSVEDLGPKKWVDNCPEGEGKTPPLPTDYWQTGELPPEGQIYWEQVLFPSAEPQVPQQRPVFGQKIANGKSPR